MDVWGLGPTQDPDPIYTFVGGEMSDPIYELKAAQRNLQNGINNNIK